MRPLLKWAGGKRNIATAIFEQFPKDWTKGNYFEPFIGGGALYFFLKPHNATISDINPRLIGFYNHLKENSEELLTGVQNLAQRFDDCPNELKKNRYYEIREEFNVTKSDSIASAINFYALNKLCFNGLYRENSNGSFNVPFGNKKKFPEIPINLFYEAAEVLSNSKIKLASFSNCLNDAKSGDFVYLDPPYIPINSTSSFAGYSAGGFPLTEQIALAELMLDMSKRGIRAICSNSDTPITREIFESLKFKVIEAPRMVSASTSGRGKINELVIRNF